MGKIVSTDIRRKHSPEVRPKEVRPKEVRPKEVRPKEVRPKEVTIRIQLIPIDLTEEDLIEDLGTLCDVLPDDSISALDSAKIRSLQPTDKDHCSATVVLKTIKPVEELINSLNEASEEIGLDYEFDCTFYGITPLWEDPDGVDCDIVAVPGLNSNPVGSWRAPRNNNLWLRDWLPKDVHRTRVLIYGYNTKLVTSTSYASIADLSQTLLEGLAAFRQDTESKGIPTILLGHSLGGLLVKEALVQSSKAPDWKPYLQEIHRVCCGLVFFGVPHDGLQRREMEGLVEGQPNAALVNSIVPNSQGEPSSYLKRLSEDFSKCFGGHYGTRVVSFFEKVATPMVVKKANGTLAKEGEPRILVTESSATKTGLTQILLEDNIAVEADHSDLTRFRSRTDERYKIAKNRIRQMLDPETLRKVEERILQASDPIEEPMEINPPTPYSIVNNQGSSNVSGVNVRGDRNNLRIGNVSNQGFGSHRMY